MNKYELLMGAYYCNELRFAQIDEIFKYILEDGKISDELSAMRKKFLSEEIKKCEDAYNLLTSEQKNCNKEIFDKIFNNMINCFYQEFNIINYKKPNITIVSRFPYPFEDRNYKAMTFSKLHEKQYNVPEGIYLMDKYAKHGIAEIMMAHEIMHYILNYFTPQEFLLKQESFLSEGLVDFISLYLLLKYNILDEICIKNWISFGRVNCTYDYIGSLYSNESKQILLIAKRAGINGLLNLVVNGIGNLVNIDLKEYTDLFNIKQEDEVLNKLISFFDNAMTNVNINVNEFYLYKKLLGVKDGIKIEKLNKSIKNIDSIKKELMNLQKKGFIYILDDVVYNTNFSIFNTIKVTLF